MKRRFSKFENNVSKVLFDADIGAPYVQKACFKKLDKQLKQYPRDGRESFYELGWIDCVNWLRTQFWK